MEEETQKLLTALEKVRDLANYGKVSTTTMQEIEGIARVAINGAYERAEYRSKVEGKIRRKVIEATGPRGRATRSEPWRRGRTWRVKLECGHEKRIRRDRGPIKTARCHECERERNATAAEVEG